MKSSGLSCDRCSPEATRYTNPLKRKFRAKRMAAESMFILHTLSVALSSHFCSLLSGWRRGSSSFQTTQRPNARRVPPTEQDSLPAKPPRERQQGSTYGLVLSVAYHSFHSLSFLTRYTDLDFEPDTQISTKSVLFPPRKISHSWSIWMREVLLWRKMLCIITNLMGRIKSR